MVHSFVGDSNEKTYRQNWVWIDGSSKVHLKCFSLLKGKPQESTCTSDGTRMIPYGGDYSMAQSLESHWAGFKCYCAAW